MAFLGPRDLPGASEHLARRERYADAETIYRGLERGSDWASGRPADEEPAHSVALAWARRIVGFDPAPPGMPDALSPLTSKARAALRAEGHALKPLLHVGKDGVTDAARRALDQAFANRALVKLRVLETAPESARATAEALAAGPDTQVVQVAGRNALLYRPLPPAPPAPAPKPTRRRRDQ